MSEKGMDKESILNLISLYCESIPLILRSEEEKQKLRYRDIGDEVIVGLAENFPEEGSEDEANQLLGFMQGVLWLRGVFTLDEIKSHSQDMRNLIVEKESLEGINGEGTGVYW